MNALLAGVLLFFLGGLAAIAVRRPLKGIVFAVCAAFAQLLILPPAFKVLLGGPALASALHFSGPIGDAFLRVDPLAAFFLLIVSLGGLLSAIYSIGYMRMYLEDERCSLAYYYFFLGLLLAAMLLVVVVQNALLFLIVWEIMSLASFFLVNFEHHKEDVRQAALYYLVAMQVGAAFLLVAFGWSAVRTGSLDFAAWRALGGLDPAAATAIFVLLFFGFGTKAGFIPMHTWLPLAHPAAPTGVSAVMSGVMIKTGIYGILRMLLVLGVPDYRLAYLVLGVSLASGIWGVMNAIAQHDLKTLLAYHSIENIGIIGMGIGVGMLGLVADLPSIALLGFLGAVLHVLNHFIFKSLPFYGVGVVYMQTHTRAIERLGGLVRVMPYTAACVLLGSLAISGLPPLNGFVSEFAVYLGMAQGLAANNVALNLAAVVGLGGLAWIGVMAVLCFTKVFGICFLGSPRTRWDHEPTEGSGTLLFPMTLLTAGIILIGMAAPLVLPLLEPVVQQFLPAPHPAAWTEVVGIYAQLQRALLVFGGLILLFVGLRWLLLRGKAVTIFKTWDCGYQAESSRLQYTAGSFAASFLELVAWMVPENKQVDPPQGLSPAHASIENHSHDRLERLVIAAPLRLLRRGLGMLTWIQSGRMQQYILYGLVFLIILVVWIIGVR